MKTFLAFVGAFVIGLSILGAIGVGDFVLIYSADKVSCTKDPR